MHNIFRLLQYEYMVPILLGFVALILLSQFLATRKGNAGRLNLYIFRSLLALYICLFIVVTQLLISKPQEWGIAHDPNLIPFQLLLQNYNYHGISALEQFFLNIVMCIPLGSLLPLSFPKRKWGYKRILLIAVMVPLITEIVQLFTGRVADVDDLIANGAGIIMGYGMIMIFWHFSRKNHYRLKNGWLVFVSLICTILVCVIGIYMIYWCVLMAYTWIKMMI